MYSLEIYFCNREPLMMLLQEMKQFTKCQSKYIYFSLTGSKKRRNANKKLKSEEVKAKKK